MMKKAALLFILFGLLFFTIGSFDFLQTRKLQKENLLEAYEMIEKQVQENKDNLATFETKKGETVGILEIPRIDSMLPIIEGTAEEELEKGVGHYQGTAFPTQEDQIVLSGHRDTVFRRMGELGIGDELIIHLPYGSFSYTIADTKIVKANDLTIIRSTAPKEELLLSTCYPFLFVGNAPERYIITAYPVEEIF